MKQQIFDFLKKNNLNFPEGERNTHSTILSGYALHVGIKDSQELLSIIEEFIDMQEKDFNLDSSDFDDYEDELKKVFAYAKKNNYEKFWKTEQAKKLYKF